MNFYEYYNREDNLENPALIAAEYLIKIGFKIIPCKGKVPTDKIRSVNKFRIKPIHEGNASFYFTDVDGIALLTGDNIEAIDCDCKYDLTGKLYKLLATAIRYTMPDLWDKLVIQRTSSGGYHFIYKCAQIGGNTKLAQRIATGDELSKGERIKTLIETRGEGGYIIISPSPDYEFIKGTPEDITEISIDERAELLAICRSFNQLIKTDLVGINKARQTDPKSPWNQFNERHNWQFIRDELLRAGWEVVREDEERVFVLRPGAKSKTSGAIWKETNILFLFSTSTEFPEMHPISAFDIIRYFKYDGDILKAARGLSEAGYGEFKKDEGEFYSITETGQIKHSIRAIQTWMHDIGIRRYFMNEKDFEIVHVINNKVHICDNNYLKKLFTDYVNKTCPREVDEFFLTRFASIFSKENIINLIERINDNFIKSTAETAWLFYRNAAIMVTANKVFFYEYNSIPGYIWAKSIIDRDFYFSESECDAKKFISNIAKQNVKSFETAIGFMLHSFKDASNPRCIILYDEFFDESKEEREPEGGTGKGIFVKMLSKFRTTAIIDGKLWNNQKNFAYQQIGPETEIVAFEDVRRNFDFESIFSVVTDDWVIEKKNLAAFSIPFEKSAKIIMTSNYPLRGTSKSHMRRRFELELSTHYNTSTTIIKEFGKRFFYEWSEKEWNHFDNYFVECLQLFLREDLIPIKSDNLERSRLAAETNKDFIFWIEKQTLPAVVTKDDFFLKFLEIFPEYKTHKKMVTLTTFTRWLKKWCEYKGKYIDTRNDFNGKMCYRFNVEKDAPEPPKPDQQPDELPF